VSSLARSIPKKASETNAYYALTIRRFELWNRISVVFVKPRHLHLNWPRRGEIKSIRSSLMREGIEADAARRALQGRNLEGELLGQGTD
jgi:hypothetical protein